MTTRQAENIKNTDEKQRIRVLFVESGTRGRGSFESLYHYLSNVDRDRFEPQVVVINDTHQTQRYRDLGITVNRIPTLLYDREGKEKHPALWKFMERLAMALDLWMPWLTFLTCRLFHSRSMAPLERLIRQERIDIVHTNNQPNREFYALWSAQRAGVPMVAHMRSFCDMGLNQSKQRWINDHVCRFVPYSQDVADHWTQSGLDGSRMRVVRNAIGHLTFSPADLQERFGLPENAWIIGMVATITDFRGHDLALQALAKIRRDHPDAYLLVIGDGDPEFVSGLQKMAGELKVDDRVIWGGAHPDGPSLIASMHALILPYNCEPFGRIVMEAWTVGTAVVLSDVGGIRSIVGDRENGVIFAAGDSDALADSLTDLIRDDAFRRRLVENGQHYCRENFSITTYCQQIAAVHEECLDESSR
ncbi:MAG: glycosyltransferase family 4 protein [Magnetococcales bacterium]|nr:glycosyltransferase family 4 protein [Magnetococcales bacterium]